MLSGDTYILLRIWDIKTSVINT